MINLLPDDKKREIRAARMNVVLLRYNLLTIAGLGLLLAMCLLFYYILHSSQENALSKNSDNSAKAASYENVRKAADEYRSDLTIARQIFDKSVNYTSVIFEITKLLPKGVILDGVTLNASDFGKQVSFNAFAKSYAHAEELKRNFQNSKFLTNVFFQNISDGTTNDDPADDTYPIVITISAKLGEVPTQ